MITCQHPPAVVPCQRPPTVVACQHQPVTTGHKPHRVLGEYSPQGGEPQLGSLASCQLHTSYFRPRSPSLETATAVSPSAIPYCGALHPQLWDHAHISTPNPTWKYPRWLSCSTACLHATTCAAKRLHTVRTRVCAQLPRRALYAAPACIKGGAPSSKLR